MRERVRCRDFGDGERIFYVDNEKIITRLMIATTLLSLFNLIFGMAINFNFNIIVGTIGLIFVLGTSIYLSYNERRFE